MRSIISVSQSRDPASIATKPTASVAACDLWILFQCPFYAITLAPHIAEAWLTFRPLAPFDACNSVQSQVCVVAEEVSANSQA